MQPFDWLCTFDFVLRPLSPLHTLGERPSGLFEEGVRPVPLISVSPPYIGLSDSVHVNRFMNSKYYKILSHLKSSCFLNIIEVLIFKLTSIV